jgi:hypothetical protein
VLPQPELLEAIYIEPPAGVEAMSRPIPFRDQPAG